MKVKKFILFSLFFLICLTSCQNDYQKYLSLMIESLNKECPIPLGAIGHMTEASYDGSTVTFNYSLTGLYDAESLEQNQEQFDVVFAVDNGKDVTLHFTNEELADNMPSYIGDPETYLQSTLQSTRLQLPITYSEGMVCTRIELDSTYFTYYFDCDEGLFNITEMQYSATENHDAVKEMLTTSSDPSFVKMMNMLKQTNRGLRYFYTGTTSGKEAIVTIESEEL